MLSVQTRRGFLATLSSTCAAGLLLGRANAVVQADALETTKIRIAKGAPLCWAPQYVVDTLLRAEGFVEIDYVTTTPTALVEALVRGQVDLNMHFAPPSIVAIDAGEPITLLAGVHVGCYELFGHEGINSIRDLKGKTVGLRAWGLSPHYFVSSMAAYVGLDPAKDIKWVLSPSVDPMELFAEKKIDAFLGTPPEPQELRARKIGHVIVNSSLDRPWSQYYCCMLTGNRDFVRGNPVATKRVLRAILKAADFCANDSVGAARQMAERGFAPRYDYALQTLNDVPYNRWREYDPEDTVRFYSLRLHEAGMIKSAPNKIIADGTDWRFLNEIKRELKS
jgi:NitT/TauT family transport system substrate-binding protein